MMELCSPPPVSGSPLPPSRFRVRSRVLGQDGRQADFRIKGPLVAPSEKETGCSRSQLARGLSGRHLLRAALNAPLPGGGPSPPPARLQAGPARCSAPTGSLVMPGWQRTPAPPTGCHGRKQQVGSEQQYKRFF